MLADDTRRFFAALRRAGTEATLHSPAGMEHVAVTRSFALPGAHETLESVTTFIDRILDGAP